MLDKTVSEMEGELERTASDVKEIDRKAADERAANEELRIEADGIRTETDMLQRQVGDLDGSVAADTAHAAAVDADRRKLKGRILEFWVRMQEIESDKDKLRQEAVENQQRVEAGESESHAFQQRLASREEQLSQVQAEVKSLEKRLSTMETRANTVECDRDRLKQAILQTAARVRDIQKEKKVLKATIAEDEDRMRAVTALEDSKKTLERTLTEISTKVINNERVKGKLENRLSSAVKEKAQFESRFKTLEAAGKT